MRANRGYSFLTALLGAGLGLSSAACGKKSSNEGFPPVLGELTGESFENPLWTLIREKLGISAIDGESLSDLSDNLATLSSLLEDPAQASSELTLQVAKVVSNAEKSVCLEVKAPILDLNPGASVGLSGAFSIVNGVPKALSLPAKVYVIQYKLVGDTGYRNAVVSVPATAPATAHMAAPAIGVQTELNGPYGYPILMYAHAAKGGLAYEEIAQTIGDLQSGYIVAAPVFPGEPLCKTYDTIGGVKSTTCSTTNILTAASGESRPYENDVIDLLGLHDCMKTAAAGSLVAVTATGASSGTENLSSKIVKVNQSAQTALATASPLLAAGAGSPVSLMAGLGRGGAVVGLALARAGAINSVYFASTPNTAVQAALASKGAKPSLFSCSLIFSPQASFTSGKNKIYLDYWAKESSNFLTAAQELALESIPAFSDIHAKISAYRTDAATDDEAKAASIADYVRDIDLLLHVPLLHGGLQNFGKQYTSKLLTASNPSSAANTAAAAQGAMLVLQGTHDLIADSSNSILLTNVGTVSSRSLASSKQAPGVKWLGLAVSPPAANISAAGTLPAGDYGHVSSANFIGGSTSTADGAMASNVATDAFIGKTPAEVTARWIGSSCVDSFNANAVP